MVYTYNELVTGANLNQRSHHWEASHCMIHRYISTHNPYDHRYSGDSMVTRIYIYMYMGMYNK